MERTASLVIRAWVEDRAGVPVLRARIVDPARTEPREPGGTVAVREDEVVEAVRRWLREFVRGDDPVTRPA